MSIVIASLVLLGINGHARADGMRAMTIRVNDVLGVAGFVLPGDRVDIMLTREVVQNQPVTNVLLQNVKVLGIDQKSDEQSNSPDVVKAVTIEVTTEQAQKIVLAATVGKLSLALRDVVPDMPDWPSPMPDGPPPMPDGPRPVLWQTAQWLLVVMLATGPVTAGPYTSRSQCEDVRTLMIASHFLPSDVRALCHPQPLPPDVYRVWWID